MVKEIITLFCNELGNMRGHFLETFGRLQSSLSDDDALSTLDCLVEGRLLLQAQELKLNFYGEETVKAGIAFVRQHRYTLLADPLDATDNYLRGIPAFAVALGVYDEELEKTAGGIVYSPLTDQLFVGIIGRGAYCIIREHTFPLSVSSVDCLADARLHITSINSLEKAGVFDGGMELMRQTKNTRVLGCSSYELALVATGGVDVTVKSSGSPWSIIPGTAIVEAAGGKVTDITGNPITRKSTSAIATNGYLHETVLGLLHGQ
ncbi:hypothetical protein J4460_05230 [Candidatus Woesearchaeota archaeon]|nr:hypothetical protein [Candidatus Woesearchaeota archaeon]HIH38356.1 hypothetical protein [Candidatus Woesearchaeota archaeon]HIH48592.1 hypothetical protein [Candidatus Woesearchaeota archaeon]HIJ03106.1 hypothetical protein [Candidatus Woesearchaeota archaeon]